MKYFAIRILLAAMRGIYAPLKLLGTKNKVTFISRQSDEPSIDINILSKELNEKHPEVEVVILARKLTPSLGYVFHVLRQMYHIATSSTVVLDSYCIPISVLNHKKDLCVIQMWHSMGCMKTFGYANLNGTDEGRDPKIAELMRMHHGYTHILISSMNYVNDYIEGFRTNGDNVLQIPLPKADYISNKDYMRKTRNETLEKYPELENKDENGIDSSLKKNILYCPTFRRNLTELDFTKVQELVDAVDFDKYNFIYKPHPVSEMKISDSRVIVFEDNNIEALAVADYLISDYSSIIYEAGLADVPVFLYAYDWDVYQDKRELNLDMKKVPALFTSDPKEIMKSIETNDFNEEAFQQFTKENIVIPETSCTEEIIKLMKIK